MPLAVFYSYSHKDEELRKQLETHLALLARNGLILPWHDRCIGAGDEWANQIDEHLRTAQIILLLVSPDFLASNYCFDIEMKAALERHAKRQAIVIPIVLRPCDWSGAPFARLEALPRDARAVTLWPNQDAAFAEIAKAIRETVVRFQRPAAEPAELASLADQATPKPRVLDAAMPTHIVKDRATELLVLIRLPESKGLMGILEDDEEAEARPDDVRSKPFAVTFPQGPTGAPEALKVAVELTSPDFSPAAQRKNIYVPVSADSEVCPFLLTPLRMGALTVTIELVWEDAERGYRRLRTNCVAEAELPTVKPLLRVVRIPVGVAREDTAAFRVTQPLSVAPGVRFPASAPVAAAMAPEPVPESPPPVRPSSFWSSTGFKVAAMAFIVVTAGTVFFQNSTQPTAAIQSAPRATAPPTPVAAAPGSLPGSLPGLQPLPAAPSPVAAARVAAPADLAATEEEFRRVSEPFAKAEKRRADPQAAAALESGEKNLAEARAELARGHNEKAEEFLKLVRIAINRLKKN